MNSEALRNSDALKPSLRYMFRDLHPLVYMGTASDRYAGWMGQIYTPELYQGRIQKRLKTVKGTRFTESVLPVESVKEYFLHFRVVELDFTFYGPLVDEQGRPTGQMKALGRYRDFLSPGDHVILKAPQVVMAQRLRTEGGFVKNPSYLSPSLFRKGFYEPATDLLGNCLCGIVMEQEYQPTAERVPVGKMATDLDEFFSKIPHDERYHLELRTPEYLREEIFSVMERHGVGHVLSHWTWLPPLKRQLKASQGRFIGEGRSLVIRLMTPLGIRYEEAYAMAFPFDKIIDGMLRVEMINEVAEIMGLCVNKGARVFVIVNNRVGGNAPQIASLIARRFKEITRTDDVFEAQEER